ncbi:efflux RND transporter periplasmic adaptor subunit [Sphingomonadaceae bacterium LXI357]|uniref:Efflux RND transporter periplasmic adaptor subunit n=2 Tax=Stakelama marina TaxID=2826939 RepID=A0A8T4IAA5_9SPHN|nr:efflux RND transporter periplasmic adaptor subunit [Stakelama marina]
MAVARKGNAVEVVYATGYVEPRHPARVAARLTAPVRSVLVDEGDRVVRGQPLILLDDREQRMQVAQAEAEASRASLDAARTLTLFGKGWVTKAARDQAVASRAASRAGAAAARARLDQMVVRAGLSGIVLKRDVQPGDLATPNAQLMQIGDPGDLWVTATVDERDVPRLRAGQRALLKSDAWPGRVLQGRLVEITPGGDPTQRAFRARIVPDTGNGLPIGLSLEVNIVTQQHAQAVVVPTSAVRDGAVWTIEQGRARRVPVTTGIVGADNVEIRSGVAAGTQVIAEPAADLKAGDRVRPARTG